MQVIEDDDGCQEIQQYTQIENKCIANAKLFSEDDGHSSFNLNRRNGFPS